MLSEPLKKKLIIESNKIVLKKSPIIYNYFCNTIVDKTVELIQEINIPPGEIVYNKEI